jgi:single-strand DNA-binding protein
MARGVNKVILIGRLGADPEVRFTTSGTQVVQFNLATSEAVKTDEGKWEERPEWHRVVVFERLAENCAKFLSKGREVYIEGKLRTRQWEDNQGIKRYTTEIVARDVQFLGGTGGQARQANSVPASGETQNAFGNAFGEELPPAANLPEDEIPF